MINPLAIALLVAQAAPPAAEPPAVQLHGWVDVFYGLNANRPADGTNFLPGTGTTARRANELNLNAAAVDVSLEPRPVGFHLTLGFGSGLDVGRGRERLQCRLRRARLGHFAAESLHAERQRLADVLLVVDDQNAGGHPEVL